MAGFECRGMHCGQGQVRCGTHSDKYRKPWTAFRVDSIAGAQVHAERAPLCGSRQVELAAGSPVHLSPLELELELELEQLLELPVELASGAASSSLCALLGTSLRVQSLQCRLSAGRLARWGIVR